MDRLLVVSSNHRLVSPSELGRLPQSQDLQVSLRAAKERGDLRGFVVLSTCNRCELYVELPEASSSFRPRRLFGTLPAVQHSGLDAVRHLIRVTSSLESMVLGENQVHGQVKAAWQVAQQHGDASAALDDLFRAALRGAREIRRRTGLGTRPVSVASLGAQSLLERLGPGPAKVAILGAGTMARKAAAAFARSRPLDLLFVNRSPGRAEDLARDFGGTALSLDAFVAAPPAVDAVFVAVTVREPVLSARLAGRIARQRGGRAPLVVVDVGVPAGAAPELAADDRVVLLDIDLLRRISARHAASRQEAAEQALPIVDKHVEALRRRLAQRDLGLEKVRGMHAELAERRAGELLEKELRHLSAIDGQKLRRALLDLAKAHAHLHLADLKRKAAAGGAVSRRASGSSCSAASSAGSRAARPRASAGPRTASEPT